MTWTVTVGCNYRPRGGGSEVRREPGDVIDDLPVKTAEVLERRGAIVRKQEDS